MNNAFLFIHIKITIVDQSDYTLLLNLAGHTGVSDGYRLLKNNFLDEVLHKNDINIYELTPNIMNKIVAFKILCRSQGFLPSIWVFENFFRFSTVEDKFAFYAQKNVHILFTDGKSGPKNWQNHCF